MRRRKFIQSAIGSAIALAAVRISNDAFAQAVQKVSIPAATVQSQTPEILRGVNLGAWLVLEKWMVPSVYEGTDAGDEFHLCQALGSKSKSQLERHRETFITAEDFRWIKNSGLNSVRLPVGYWALEAPKPYVSASDYIEFALDQAQENNLRLVLD